jgi:hypothetical protein
MSLEDEREIYEKRQIQRYCKSMQTFIFESKFTNETLKESEDFVSKNFPDGKGCIYCSPFQLSSSYFSEIPFGSTIIMLELNEDMREVVGIGLVINRSYLQKYIVHKVSHLNIYSYLGKLRIKREDMNKKEESIMKLFDIFCFHGMFRHSTTSSYLQMFPPKILWRAERVVNLTEELLNMFRSRNGKHIIEEISEPQQNNWKRAIKKRHNRSYKALKEMRLQLRLERAKTTEDKRYIRGTKEAHEYMKKVRASIKQRHKE